MVISEDETISRPLDLAQYETQGFCDGYPARRHNYEKEADIGLREARADWVRYIGPVDIAGGCNPFSGHFASLVLPTCKPERLRLISYVFEYAFLHDNVLESAAKAAEGENDSSEAFGPRGHQLSQLRSVVGSKQIQSKMMLEMLSVDLECANAVIDAWRVMVDTTSKRAKTTPFTNMEDYIDYRIVDAGAPFVDKLMLFGLGMTLSQDELAKVTPITRPCYAALGLANDYFSFDVEYEVFKNSPAKTMTNAVWLFMYWDGASVAEAKDYVRVTTRKYERQFAHLRKENEGTLSPKLRKYLLGLAYQVSGNVIWSLDNPRYHPDKNVYEHDMIDWDCSLVCSQKRPRVSSSPPDSALETSDEGDSWPFPGILAINDHSRRSSVESFTESLAEGSIARSGASSRKSSLTSLSSTAPPDGEGAPEESWDKNKVCSPGEELVMAPFDYISSLPAKGARDAFIDALTVWLPASQGDVDRIKETIRMLHNASLMLDDIEDGSQLRRGRPAAHKIFGVAHTINSAGYLVLDALKQVQMVGDPQCLNIVIDQVRDLYVGQTFDVYWTRSGHCPSEKEHLEIVDKKTGGLFQLPAKLLQCLSDNGNGAHIEQMISLFGRFFQIRDDYQNLTDKEYNRQKGFCEDLDEGKYSFPLIYALNAEGTRESFRLEALLHSRRENGCLSREGKELVLEHLREAGSMEHTRRLLEDLRSQIEEEMARLEALTGGENWILRLLMSKLKL